MSRQALPLAVLGLAALLSCSSQSSKQVVNSDAGTQADAGTLVCVPGATQRCLGQNLCDGVQICDDDGSRYGACDCGTASGGSGGSGGSDASGGASNSGGSGGSDASGGAANGGTAGDGGSGGSNVGGSGGASGGDGGSAGTAGSGGTAMCLDQACTAPDDCCPDRACNGAGQCAPTCNGPQGACGGASDCCYGYECGFHISSYCCGPVGAPCATFSDCCGATAICDGNQRCAAGTCVHGGWSCFLDVDCCSNNCYTGQCLSG